MYLSAGHKFHENRGNFHLSEGSRQAQRGSVSGVFWDSPLKMKSMLLDFGPLPPRKMHNAGWASGFNVFLPWLCCSNSFAG